MTLLSITNPFPPVTSEELVRVERQLGIDLPDDYRSFLLEHNGGRPKPNTFPIHNFPSSSRGILEEFIGIKKGAYTDIRKQLNVFRDRIPPDCLPIARDPGGNLLCLVFRGPGRGTIYFWDHEEEAEEGRPASKDNLYFVASSFNTLLSSLAE